MRVLWFSINASCYNSALTKGGYNGGGWVSSLEKIIKKQKNIHLGIAFEFESDKFKDSIDGVDYYPINVLKIGRNILFMNIRSNMKRSILFLKL